MITHFNHDVSNVDDHQNTIDSHHMVNDPVSNGFEHMFGNHHSTIFPSDNPLKGQSLMHDGHLTNHAMEGAGAFIHDHSGHPDATSHEYHNMSLGLDHFQDSGFHGVMQHNDPLQHVNLYKMPQFGR